MAAKPLHVSLKSTWEGDSDQVPLRDNSSDRRKVAIVQKSVRRFITSGKPSAALKLLESPKTTKALTPIELDQLRYWVSASFYYGHANEEAYDLAHDVAERRRETFPMADWIAGLASWQLGKVEESARHFEQLANSNGVGQWVRPAAAYWAARANLVAGVPERVTKDLKIAAKSPSTFYGLLALRQLGEVPKFTWSMPTVSQDDMAKAMAMPAVKRAISLAQIGETEEADLEMRRGHALASPTLDCALVVISAQYQLAGAQLHVAETSGVPGLDAALYPIRPTSRRTASPSIRRSFMRSCARKAGSSRKPRATPARKA